MHKALQSIKLTLLNIAYAQLDSSWDYDNVISPFSRLYYITKGKATVYHSNQTFNLRPGFVYLIPSYTYSRYSCDEYLEQYYISFLEELNNGQSIYNVKHFVYETKATEDDVRYFKRLLTLNPNRGLVNDDPKVYDNRPYLSNVEKRNEELSTPHFMETQALLQLLLSRFVQDANIVQSNMKTDFNDVLNYIGEHLNETLTVRQLAEFCHLSPDHFSRMFQKKFGMRPSRYLQTKRIERAQLLLLTTNNSLSEIAHKIGMDNLSYFSRIFKKLTGKTPGDFRKERPNV